MQNKKITDILQGAIQKKNQRTLEEERNAMWNSLGSSVVNALRPILAQIAQNATFSSQTIESAVSRGIKSGLDNMKLPEPRVTVESPVVNIPDIIVPPIPAPNVSVEIPPIKVPDIVMPSEMTTRGWLNLVGWDKALLNNPIPVQLRDARGNPVTLDSSGGVSVGGGGGKMDFFTVKGITNTVGVVTINPDGTPTYSTSSSGAGATTVSLVNVDGLYYNSDNPLPVTFSAASVQPVSQVSGNVWSVYAQDALTTVTATSLVNADNRLRVSVETGGSGLTDAELRATAVPVSQVSGANWSVTIAGALATVGVVTINPDGNPTYSSSSSGLTDAELRASSVPVEQVSGSTWSTSIASQPITLDVRQVSGAVDSVSVNNTVTVTATDLDIRDLVNATDSVSAYQVSGASWSVFATNPVDNGDAATALRVVVAGNSAASVTATQTGTWNIGTVTTVTGVTNSVAASIVDSSGVMYGSANPMHIAVHDSTGSTISSFPSGDIKGLAVAIVDGSGNQITSFGGGTQYAEGATASTYTGTAVMFAEASTDAAKVVSSVDPLPVTLATSLSSSIDSVLSRPIKLRGSLVTAYATLSSNAETTLISASAGNFRDLVWVKFSNTSAGAVTIDLRDSSAGNIVDTYEIPANSSTGISMAVPYPQGNVGNAWTVDYNDSDLSNTTVYVSALFSNET